MSRVRIPSPAPFTARSRSRAADDDPADVGPAAHAPNVVEVGADEPFPDGARLVRADLDQQPAARSEPVRRFSGGSLQEPHPVGGAIGERVLRLELDLDRQVVKLGQGNVWRGGPPHRDAAPRPRGAGAGPGGPPATGRWG